MMSSTPSPQLSREEQLALWREQKQKKQQTPKIRDSFASTSAPRSSGSGASRPRRRPSHRRESVETSFKTPIERRQSINHFQEESPFVVPARSYHVSCRKPRIPRARDLSTASSRMKQRSLKPEASKTPHATPIESRRLSYRPRKSLSAEQYLSNRPSMQKENSGGSLVNQIRSRAARKRGQDGDESSKPDSRATTYRTPLSYGDSIATAQDPHNGSSGENVMDPDSILDISISLPFEDLLSPLSTTSVAVSPASTISSEKMVKRKESPAVGESQQVTTTPVPDASKPSLINDSPVPEKVEQDVEEHSQPSLQPTTDHAHRQAASQDDNADETSQADRNTNEVDSGVRFAGNTTIESNLDFEGIEDDDSGLEESILDRRRRRRDSTFLRLPKPEKTRSISPDPSKSAFAPVLRQQFGDSVKRESPLDHWSPSLLSSNESSPVPAVAHRQTDAATQLTEESGETELPTLYLSREVTKVNNRAILERIPESTDVCQAEMLSQQMSTESPMLRLEIQTLREEASVLRISKATLEKKLYTIRHSYEERVTPFRDVFEDMRKLRSENKAMKEEKNTTRVMVEGLKQQMMIGLQSAVDKTQALQKQVDTVTAEKEELEEQLRQIRQRAEES